MKATKKEILEFLENNDIDFSNSVFDNYRNDKEVVKKALCKSEPNTEEKVLSIMGSKLKDNEAFFNELLNENIILSYQIMENASPRLQDNKRFVVRLINLSRGRALKFASDRLKNDIEVVLIAVKKSEYVINFASKEIQNKVNHEIQLLIDKQDELVKKLEIIMRKEKLEKELTEKPIENKPKNVFKI